MKVLFGDYCSLTTAGDESGCKIFSLGPQDEQRIAEEQAGVISLYIG